MEGVPARLPHPLSLQHILLSSNFTLLSALMAWVYVIVHVTKASVCSLELMSKPLAESLGPGKVHHEPT